MLVSRCGATQVRLIVSLNRDQPELARKLASEYQRTRRRELRKRKDGGAEAVPSPAKGE